METSHAAERNCQVLQPVERVWVHHPGPGRQRTKGGQLADRDVRGDDHRHPPATRDGKVPAAGCFAAATVQAWRSWAVRPGSLLCFKGGHTRFGFCRGKPRSGHTSVKGISDDSLEMD